MGAEAKLYLQEHRIPQLFEGLMTGLIYNRPPDPISFLEQSLYHIKTHPDDELTWDMFIEKGMTSSDRKSIASKRVTRPVSKDPKSPETVENRRVSRESREKTGSSGMGLVRTPSVTKAAQVADIPHVPIILFMGGPGGGKTRHAAKVASSLSEQGLIHICMPDIIRQALTRYKDKYPEWREANEHYARGELIPNHLALALVKAEMGRHKNATAFFLEGFPREARQVEDFERQVKNVNMALIIDYDEKTLRDHMEKRGLGMEIIDQKIKEFKQKTLPSAKYFDDQKLLHLIPGERDDHTIYERMRGLVTKAMETGVPVINSNPPSQQTQRPEKPRTPPVAVPAPPLPPSIPVRESTPTKIIGAEEPVFEVPPIPTIVPLPEIPSEVRVTPPTAEPSNTIVTTATIHNSRPTSQHRKSTAEGQRAATPKRNATPKDPPRTTSSQYNTAEVPSGLPNNAPVVLLVGAPGALKNDVAKLITQKYDGFVLISMGELLRKTVNESPDDELWNRINTKILEGEPVPTKLCRQLLYNEIHTVGQGAWGYVVEGYPRTISQLDDFEGVVARVDVAILIDCTEQFCEEMVKKRFEKSGHRKDDSPEVFKVRLAAFKQNTLPMLKHLDERGKLRVVDGDGDADTVFKEVSQVIDAALFIEEDDGSGGSLDESKKSLRTQQQQQQAV